MGASVVWDVMRFELRRSSTPSRAATWFVLVAFPIALISVLRVTTPVQNAERWGLMLYFLVPEVVCLLGLLLWATPVISTEIEGQTWIYLALRRSGRSLVLLGKYLTAVLWSVSAALVSISICVIVMGPAGGWKVWWVMCSLSVLSCFAHASLYILIGTVFFRRTMVAAVFYTMVIEYGLARVPAVANKMTINYRLRGLLADWTQWPGARSIAEDVLGSESTATHLFALAVISAILLAIAVLRLSRAELPTQQEG
jgi:ABC-type transport system involved in multi-copper enzyme maturation permease subunit